MGCGAKRHPEELERFVYDESVGLVHDLRRKGKGRGVYVDASTDCLAKAAKSGFSRGFKASVTTDASKLVEDVKAALLRRLQENARLSVSSRDAAVGANAVEQAMKRNELTLLFIASDAGDGTQQKYASNADRKGLQVVRAFGGEEVGRWSGRDFVAVMGVGGRVADRLVADVEGLRRLGAFGVEGGGEA